MLNREQCQYVRSVASNAFTKADGNCRKAIRIARQELRNAPESIIASIAISLAIRVAIWLIKKWIEKKFSSPPAMYQAWEIGFSGLSAADEATLQSPEFESDE